MSITMASNRKLLFYPRQNFKSELSFFNMSDDEIKKQICVTHAGHAHSDREFNVGSLFAVVKNILNPATIVAGSVVQGTKQAHQETRGEVPLKVSCKSPLCTLKQLSCEMACKAPGEAIANQTAMSILNKLSSYSWGEKAVLTLAAFALDYGDFWHFAHSDTSDQLTKSLGILKRVPLVLTRPSIEKHGEAIVELNNLIKATVEVIEYIFKLEERYSKYDIKNVPILSIAMDSIPVDAFWAIITIVACTTRMCCIINDGDKAQELLPFARQINVILNSLTKHINRCDQEIEEIKAYRDLKKFLANPTDIVDVLKALIFAVDNGQGGNNFPNKLDLSNIEEVRTKNVLFYFSDLDISDEDVSMLKLIHEKINKTEYKIVWIPIVEQWTNDMKKKFEEKGPKMPWYIVQQFSSVSGIKYVKKQWHFNNRSTIVVLNPQGKVEHLNALFMMKIWGPDAFPFTIAKEKELSTREDWFGRLVFPISPEISTWIKDGKYIFFYGGKDTNWIQQFRKKARELAVDQVIKHARISIELFCVGKEHNEKHDLEIERRFWDRIENFFSSHKGIESDLVTKVVPKLLSYRAESGWVLLCKGSTLMFNGHGTTSLKVLEQYDQWKQHISPQFKFEICFNDHYEKIRDDDHPCLHIDIPKNAKIPESIKCPDCHRIMEMYIRLKCCHIN